MLDKTNRFLFDLRGHYPLLIIFATGQFERTKTADLTIRK